MTVSLRRCVIVGSGLIGSSLAMAMKESGLVEHVVGVGRGADNLARALERGCVDSVSQDPVAAVVDADLIVLATPVGSAVELLPTLAAAAPKNAWFTDVGSVKQPIVSVAAACGIGERFIGAHPIAGGTSTGAEAATASLFRGRTVVLTPDGTTSTQTLARGRALWEASGAMVFEMTPKRHDEMLAYTSHLPQFVVFALCGAIDRAGDLPHEMFGSGFRDTTRLGTSDHEMWLGIAEKNREALLTAMDSFGAVWAELRAAIANDDGATVLRLLREARKGKERSGS